MTAEPAASAKSAGSVIGTFGCSISVEVRFRPSISDRRTISDSKVVALVVVVSVVVVEVVVELLVEVVVVVAVVVEIFFVVGSVLKHSYLPIIWYRFKNSNTVIRRNKTLFECSPGKIFDFAWLSKQTSAVFTYGISYCEIILLGFTVTLYCKVFLSINC